MSGLSFQTHVCLKVSSKAPYLGMSWDREETEQTSPGGKAVSQLLTIVCPMTQWWDGNRKSEVQPGEGHPQRQSSLQDLQ